MTSKWRAPGKWGERGKGRAEGRIEGRLRASVVTALGCELAQETGGRQREGVAWPARAEHGLCWVLVSWSLGLFGQELAHEDELAEPAVWAYPVSVDS